MIATTYCLMLSVLTAATLLQIDTDTGVRLLFSRKTHFQFGYAILIPTLALYYILACWCSGTSLASGIVLTKL